MESFEIYLIQVHTNVNMQQDTNKPQIPLIVAHTLMCSTAASSCCRDQSDSGHLSHMPKGTRATKRGAIPLTSQALPSSLLEKLRRGAGHVHAGQLQPFAHIHVYVDKIFRAKCDVACISWLCTVLTSHVMGTTTRQREKARPPPSVCLLRPLHIHQSPKR